MDVTETLTAVELGRDMEKAYTIALAFERDGALGILKTIKLVGFH